MKKENAITLIALIISIIILLILTGVTISATIGNNGILNQAVNAADSTNIEKEKEQITMEIAATINLNGKIDMNTLKLSIEKKGFNCKIYGNKMLIKKGENNFLINNDGKIEILLNEEITFSKLISSNNYGDFVRYPIDLNNNNDYDDDWKIFFNNKNDIFLISSFNIDNSSNLVEKNLTGLTPNSYLNYTTGFYWSNIPEMYNINPEILNLFCGTNYSLNNLYNNSKCVSTLLNTNNWTNFVNETYADYAIGSPTIEMWLKSCNKKYSENFYYNNTNDYGYYIGTTEVSKETVLYFSETISNDTLYFPTHEEYCSYWIASPGARNENVLYYVRTSSQYIGNNPYTGSCTGIRPIIHLKNDIGVSYENNIWILQDTF